MSDLQTKALLRSVFEEVCENVSPREIGARTHVASKLLEAATMGLTSLDDLRRAGSRALMEVSGGRS